MPSPSERRLLPIVLAYLPLPVVSAVLSVETAPVVLEPRNQT